MTESEVNESLSAAQLLLMAIADEPEIFMDQIGEHDYDDQFVRGYFSGLLEISRGCE